MSLQEQYDEGMFAFSQADYDRAITLFEKILAEDPDHFDAQLSVGMAWFRKGDYPKAIEEGHKAQKLKPHEQLVHTNLSLFYMRAGDKTTAEHHGLQARIASWKTPAGEAPAPAAPGDPELQMANSAPPPPIKLSSKLSDPPWKKKASITASNSPKNPTNPE
ncbi:MAG: tetratricopeptide repeat protein [Verrucomicrobiales bacterium]